jgi:hypothetical protein
MKKLEELDHDHAVRVANIMLRWNHYTDEVLAYIGQGMVRFHLCGNAPMTDEYKEEDQVSYDRIKNHITNIYTGSWHHVIDMLRSEGYPLKNNYINTKDLANLTREDAIRAANISIGSNNYGEDYLEYVGRGIVIFHILGFTPWSDQEPHDTVSSRRHICDVDRFSFLRVVDMLRDEGYEVNTNWQKVEEKVNHYRSLLTDFSKK